MCGVAGIARSTALRQTDPSLLDTMLGVLRHRGPDEQRRFADGHGAIGARRLSIIDLETGGQTIGNADGTIHVTQNCEIYNYVELREELQIAARLGLEEPRLLLALGLSQLSQRARRIRPAG